MTTQKICYNGSFYNKNQAVLQAEDKSYRYGDGFFETIKVWKGAILLPAYHQQRIEATLALMQYQLPALININQIFEEVLDLCIKNNCSNAARVRLSFSNGNGGLFERNHQLHYLIEAEPLESVVNDFNENGLVTGFFENIKKSCDAYANVKSSSAMLYAIAARHSYAQKWNEAIILNQRENICESIIGNIFWIKDDHIFTPPLTEGCVSGVMRAYLIHQLDNITETPCRRQDILQADEVFLTNAIRGIRWVKSIQDRVFDCKLSPQLHRQFIQPLF